MEQANHLEIADSLIRNITGEQSPQIDALVSIAAALIAAVDKPTTFVQVGKYWVDIAHIVSIEDTTNTLYIYSHGSPSAILHGEERTAFLHWWNEYANVVRLDTPGECDDLVKGLERAVDLYEQIQVRKAELQEDSDD